MKLSTFSKLFFTILLTAATLFSVVLAADSEKDPQAPIKNLQFQSADINSVLTFLSDYGKVNVVEIGRAHV